MGTLGGGTRGRQDSAPQLVHRDRGHGGLNDRAKSGSREVEKALEAMVET